MKIEDKLGQMREEQERREALNREADAFVAEGWDVGTYYPELPMFAEGTEASSDDFVGLLGLGDWAGKLEGKVLTRAWPKTNPSGDFTSVYLKLGNQRPPEDAWSRREVWEVRDGRWVLLEREG